MQLSKSRYVAGHQCHRLLWWKVHEPNAVELQPDKVLQDRFDQGAQVGALARGRFEGGVRIELPHHAIAERLELTKAAMADGAPAIFEGTFVADDTRVDVDVLRREGDAWRLIEVKSSTSQKDEHLPDAAVQLHVLRRSGVDVRAVEIMHLNKEYRLSADGGQDLFARIDVTKEVGPLLPTIPDELHAQLEMLDGSLPDVPVGLHCSEPRECPFMERCWPREPDHISKLYNVGPVKCHDYMISGVHHISDLSPTQKLPAAAKRQIRAMQEKRLIVEPTLHDALGPFEVRLGFLDFETIQRAVPVWPGMGPWEQAAAQFSYHVERSPRQRLKLITEHAEHTEEPYDHFEFLAEGPQDARPALARAMVACTKDAARVVTYSSFEKTRIRGLQVSVPELRDELLALEHKLIDLLPVIRDNVYHPEFYGSFSLKKVLPALVPGLTYEDLVIIDGQVASVEIARLLFVAGKIDPAEHARVRHNLLDYCERDTWAMVKLLERLRNLAD